MMSHRFLSCVIMFSLTVLLLLPLCFVAFLDKKRCPSTPHSTARRIHLLCFHSSTWTHQIWNKSGTERPRAQSSFYANIMSIKINWIWLRDTQSAMKDDETCVCVLVCVKPPAQPLLTSRLYLSVERGNLPAHRLRPPPAAPSEVICHFRPIFTWLLRQERSDTEVARSSGM